MRRNGKTALAVCTEDGIKTTVRTDKSAKCKSRAARRVCSLFCAAANFFLFIYDYFVIKSKNAKTGAVKTAAFLAGIAALVSAAAFGADRLFCAAEEAVLLSGYSGNLFKFAFYLVLAAAAVSILRAIPPMRRLFKFHAAEHMVINCVESGKALTPENIRSSSRIHPRCGTITDASVIIAVFTVILALPPGTGELLSDAVYIAAVILSIYVSVRLVKSRKKSRFTDALLRPGRMAELITTIPPDDIMLECAAAAAERLIGE